MDLRAAEALFGVPRVPIWPEHAIDAASQAYTDVETTTLASFHSPFCSCGRPFGICYDLGAILRTGHDPNEVLLHEMTHAWQYFRDPVASGARHNRELAEYGYWDAPFEVEAREMAAALNDAGLRVWFPEG